MSSTCEEDHGCFDNSSCIVEQSKYNCKSIGYVLREIISNDNGQINTVYLNNGYTSDGVEVVTYKDKLTSTPRRTVVTCLTPCNITLNLTISFRHHHPDIIFVIQGARILHSNITVQNVQMHFVDVFLQTSLISDTNPRAGEFGEVGLWFYNAAFEEISDEIQFSVDIDKTFIFCVTLFTVLSTRSTSGLHLQQVWFMCFIQLSQVLWQFQKRQRF